MSAELFIPAQPKHPLHALATFELRDYRRQLENAVARLGTEHPAPAVRDSLRASLDAVIAEQESRAQLRRYSQP
jgi:DNA-binding GntR family transcriptional regulator